MKTVVVYKSKTGFTKRYAQWVAQELAADLFEAAKVTAEMLTAYDTIIYGGSLHAVGICGVKRITNHLTELNGKKIVVFATGASPAKEEAINHVIESNFTPQQLAQIRFFYLRGGFDYGKLNTVDKFLMTFLKWKLKRKQNLTADEKGMLAAYDTPLDFTRKENIAEIISYVSG